MDCTCVRPSRDDTAVYEYWKLTNPVSTSSSSSRLGTGDNRRTGVMDRLLILPLRNRVSCWRVRDAVLSTSSEGTTRPPSYSCKTRCSVDSCRSSLLWPCSGRLLQFPESWPANPAACVDCISLPEGPTSSALMLPHRLPVRWQCTRDTVRPGAERFRRTSVDSVKQHGR